MSKKNEYGACAKYVNFTSCKQKCDCNIYLITIVTGHINYDTLYFISYMQGKINYERTRNNYTYSFF